MTTHPAAPGGEPIWRPGPEAAASSAIARFGRYVTERTGVELGTYLDLHRWSTGPRWHVPGTRPGPGRGGQRGGIRLLLHEIAIRRLDTS